MNKAVIGRRLLPASMLVACATLTGCFDDNYDLSDIDMTARVQVNDLVLPVRIDAINLGDIITIKDDSRIKEIDNQYVLIEEGSFSSDEIRIAAIEISRPYIPAISIDIADAPATAAAIPAIPIGRHTTSFSYVDNSVSEHIRSIGSVTTDFTIRLSISLTGNAATASGVSFSDLCLQLPAGLEGQPSAGSYDKGTGIVTISEATAAGGSLDFSMAVTGIDASAAGIIFDADSRHFQFASEIGIASGNVSVSSGLAAIAGSQLTIAFDLSPLRITSFSGHVRYAFDGINIAPVTLGDLPSVLSQSETNVALSNPQIYLSVGNPLAPYGLSASAGLSITPWRDGAAGQSYGLDRGSFAIASQSRSNFCMAPEQPAKYYPGYDNPSFEPYSGLRDVLRGAGLPDELAITIVDPKVQEGTPVTNLPIGSGLGTVTGNYTLYAPLALAAGSEIVYTDTEAEWNDEDVDAITIEALTVTATVTNNLPVDIHLSGYPIDKEGNRINNVEIKGTDVAAGAKSAPFKLHITGTVTHLDGITFTAKAAASDTDTALSPTQAITLNDIRATVSGHYTKDLSKNDDDNN